MKFTIPLSLLLLSSSSSANNENHLRAQAIEDNETDQLQESSQQRNLQYATRKEGWLAAHNTRRESYHTSLGGTYAPLTWSKPLKRQALKYARQMAQTCMPYVPTDTSYGVSSSARQGYPNLPTTNWVVSRWEDNINDDTKNYPMVQALWSKTEYVGCADSYNKSKKCSVSVCVYAKAGNCNMGQYDGWEDAIMNGPGCGACPPDVPNC